MVFERVGIWVDVRKWLKYCKAKIGVLGLGVNHIPPELEVELAQLIEASEFFYVRDIESKELLQHPKVKVYPDLTWCFPIDIESDNEKEEGIALNLLPCHWKEFNHDAWIKNLPNTLIHPFPFHFNKNRDHILLKHYFGETTPSEFSLSPLKKSRILIGCRYHSIVFSMQVGKPFIAINYDKKVERLLQESNLSECCLETTEHHLLRAKIDFVLDREAELKERIEVFAALQKKQAIKLRESVHSHLVCTPSPMSGSLILSLKSVLKSYIRGW